ncbi:F0F1 ATP synthase subunit B family protein [Planctomicrobium piriforme]|uniref:F-type H+-transporting ATPase subunit b n=1 Tax=Planctomicrobium piriforme TaxID=1576369 RepID=A0A1I3S3V7_9PLAN|nr:ATP synthase F0 subunit B [Planctomicrobium piriforme]SFJ53484.1 F-type H+-transporting ATPase subunit b [Planctomicrobium piriforme]
MPVLRMLFAVVCVAVWGILLPSVIIAQQPATAPAEVHAAEAHAADGHETTGHDAAHDEHHEKYSFWADLPFWSAVAFVGLCFAVKKLGLWDLLIRSMSEREQAENAAIGIAETDLADAQTLLRQAKGRLEAMDEQISEILAEAGRDSASTQQEILQLAQREANASVQRARNEIDRVRDQSLNEIFAVLADRVTATAEQQLRSGLGPRDHDRLIGEALHEVVVQ